MKAQRIISALQRYEKLSLRERLLVAVAVLGLFWLVFYLSTLSLEKKKLMLNQQLTTARAALTKLETEKTGLDTRLRGQTAHREARARELEQALASQEQAFLALQSRLVTAKDMPGLLQSVLRQRSGLELVSLRSLPPQALNLDENSGAGEMALAKATAANAPANSKANPAPEAGANPADAHQTGTNQAGTPLAEASAAKSKAENRAPYYRQSLEIVVAGRYGDLLAYVRDLEALPQKLLWQSLSFQVEVYPRVRLTLRLATLSEEASWLEI